jgi:hypothetical protein
MLSLLLALANAAGAAPAKDIDEDFNNLNDWDQINLYCFQVAPGDKRLLLGNDGGTNDGALGSMRQELEGDWEAKGQFWAAVDLGSDSWATRAVTVRVVRDDNVVAFARLTVWKETRAPGSPNKARLTVGIRQADGTVSVEVKDLDDETTTGQLKLEIDDTDAWADMDGVQTDNKLPLTASGSFTGVGIEMLADPDLAAGDVSVSEYDAISP